MMLKQLPDATKVEAQEYLRHPLPLVAPASGAGKWADIQAAITGFTKLAGTSVAYGAFYSLPYQPLTNLFSPS
jgi:hypothetical protein